MPPRNAAKRQNCCAATRKVTPRAANGFNWIARICCLCVLYQGLQNLDAFVKKVLIVAVRRCHCGELIRGLQNLGAPCKRNVFRAFRLYEKNQKYTRGLRTSGLRGAIQRSAGSDSAKFSGGSCRNRFCLQNGGEKALNRCERVTVVQTQD